ncbi:hypothetical protein F2P79_025667, partial [Pimephales promelas]
MDKEEDISSIMHSYAKKAPQTQAEEGEMEVTWPEQEGSDSAQPLNSPKLRAAKRSKITEDEGQSVPNSVLLMIMERVEKMQQESLRKLQSLEATVKDNTCTIKSVTDAVEYMGKQLKEATDKVETLEKKVGLLEKENGVLRDRCNELDNYKRRWNLRVAGVKEQAGENVKKMMVDLFSQVSPDIAEQLAFSIDIAHRLGPRSGEVRSHRRIIVQFLSRTHRDKIWKDARTSTILKERKIKIFEDLTQDVKDARNKLWPLVEQARKEGKKAGFRGHFAHIDGKR